jgi:hypothetical protein
LTQLPVDAKVAIIGDSTLTDHFNEKWEARQIVFDWPARAVFLQQCGFESAEIYAVPGAVLRDFLWQARTAVRQAPDYILLVGGWSQKEENFHELLAELTALAAQ